LYYAEMDVEGQYDPGSSFHISGSKVEVVGIYSQMFVYKDNDGVPGLQISITQPNIVCPPIGPDPPYDCIQSFKAFSDLNWGTIQRNSQKCPSGYPSNCTVDTITLATTGSDAGTCTITATVTSLPVSVNGVLITPKYMKVALDINNPYPSQGSNVYLGILAVGAGKTSSASADVGLNRHGLPTSIDFTTNGKTCSFQWESTISATVSSSKRVVTTSSNVITQNITGDSISNYLSNCGISCSPFVLILGVIVDFCQANGWSIIFVFFSFPVDQLSYLNWDPCVGECPSGSSSMGALTAPLFWLTVCMVLAHLWWSWKHM